MNEQYPLFSSIHNHTIFCDGKDDVETMCRAAYEKKLYSVGFSAHAPVEKQICIESNWNMKEEKVNDYLKEVISAKKRWEDKLKVFVGLEVDYIKGRRSPLDSDIKAMNLDYIIGCVHFLYPENNAEPFTVDGSAEEFKKGLNEGYNGDAEALMHSYYDAVSQMISEGGFDVLGHADLLKKNCQNKYFWAQEKEIERQKEIAYKAAKAGLVVEVNTGGINRNKINDTYPSLSFLRIIREFNIPVTITADAHCAKDINGNYSIALNTLNMADFNEHMLFNGKINKKIEWKKEKLIKM